MVKAARNGRRNTAGLVLHQGGARGGDPPIVVLPDARVELCGQCQAPAFLCRLDHDDGELSPPAWEGPVFADITGTRVSPPPRGWARAGAAGSWPKEASRSGRSAEVRRAWEGSRSVALG